MDPGNLDLDSGRCSCPSSSTHGMKPLERRRKREHQRCLAHSLVGTPNYIAPEVIFVILLIFQENISGDKTNQEIIFSPAPAISPRCGVIVVEVGLVVRQVGRGVEVV